MHVLPRGLSLPTIGHSTFVCMGFNGIYESLGGLAECGGKAQASVIMTIDFMSFRYLEDGLTGQTPMAR